MKFRRKLRKGISELVIILALIAIVVPIVMVVQGWLSSKAGSLDSVNVVRPLSGYLVSRTYTNGREVITIGIKNQDQTAYNITEFKAILTDGRIVNAQQTTGTTKNVIEPGSEKVFVVTVDAGSTRVKSIIVTAAEVATNKLVELPVNVG